MIRMLFRSGAITLLLAGVAHVMAQRPSRGTGGESFFTLPHQAAEAMAAEDAALWQSRQNALLRAAAIHDYSLDAQDISGKGAWTVEQTRCPLIRTSLLLHYEQRYPDGSESAFAAVIPRNGDPVRVIAALHHGAVNFTPSYKSADTYALFHSLVTASDRKQALSEGGSWLTLAACYAALTGLQPQIPVKEAPHSDAVAAPMPRLRVEASHKEYEIQFADLDRPRSYALWTIRFDRDGRLVQVRREEHSADAVAMVQHPEPAADMIVSATEPTARVLAPVAEPAARPIQPTEQPSVKTIPDVRPQ